jgi:hypothetical protein
MWKNIPVALPRNCQPGVYALLCDKDNKTNIVIYILYIYFLKKRPDAVTPGRFRE